MIEVGRHGCEMIDPSTRSIGTRRGSNVGRLVVGEVRQHGHDGTEMLRYYTQASDAWARADFGGFRVECLVATIKSSVGEGYDEQEWNRKYGRVWATAAIGGRTRERERAI
jgi:hypothetical protein